MMVAPRDSLGWVWIRHAWRNGWACPRCGEFVKHREAINSHAWTCKKRFIEKKKMKFEIIKAKAGQWYWRIKAKNGKILAHSETYKRKSDAEHAVNLVKESAGAATVFEVG